ncbi:hypothetical protein KCU99_g71, partial [Aureobasidium melanogenum]
MLNSEYNAVNMDAWLSSSLHIDRIQSRPCRQERTLFPRLEVDRKRFTGGRGQYSIPHHFVGRSVGILVRTTEYLHGSTHTANSWCGQVRIFLEAALVSVPSMAHPLYLLQPCPGYCCIVEHETTPEEDRRRRPASQTNKDVIVIEFKWGKRLIVLSRVSDGRLCRNHDLEGLAECGGQSRRDRNDISMKIYKMVKSQVDFSSRKTAAHE